MHEDSDSDEPDNDCHAVDKRDIWIHDQGNQRMSQHSLNSSIGSSAVDASLVATESAVPGYSHSVVDYAESSSQLSSENEAAALTIKTNQAALKARDSLPILQKSKRRRSSLAALRDSIRLHSMFLGIPLLHVAKPVFVPLQILTVCVLYAVSRLLHGDARAGLDSIWPSKTDLRMGFDCHDHRREVWRLFTYQFTHVSIRHLCMNSVMLLAAVPLERFHGSLRVCVFFNIGVLGGALCWAVSDGHSIVVGMSGGCFAIFGLYLADLLINWHEKVYGMCELLALLATAASGTLEALIYDEGRVSHSAHVGGCAAGLLICAAFGRNAKETRCTASLRLTALIIGIPLLAFAACWGYQWPPRNIWTSEPWCWIRMVSNWELFGDIAWHCVRCDSQACIDRWSQEEYIHQTSERNCFRQLGGWAVTER